MYAKGAADGAAASVSTPEKLLTINSPVILRNDDKLEVTVELDASEFEKLKLTNVVTV